MPSPLMLPSFPKSVKLLHDGRTTVGLRSQEKSYIIGFSVLNGLDHFEHTRGYISTDSKMKLRNVHFENVIEELNFYRANLSSDMNIDKVMMATNAKLFIEKGVKDTDLYLQSLNMEEYLLYPFTKNMGIIITNDLETITENNIVFDVHIIAQTFTTSTFDNFQ
jgi:hypothetical protein